MYLIAFILFSTYKYLKICIIQWFRHFIHDAPHYIKTETLY